MKAIVVARSSWLRQVRHELISLLSSLVRHRRQAKDPTWLDELTLARVADQKMLETRQLSRTDALNQERKRVARFVKALLKDVGRAYWGSVGKEYSVMERAYHASYGWRVSTPKGEGYDEWAIDLNYRDNGTITFLVYGKDFTFQTEDTSESSVEAALQAAVAAGPKYRWIGG